MPRCAEPDPTVARTNGASRCRGCGGGELRAVLDLGAMPLADALRDPDAPAGEEARYPLELAYCPACHLLQVLASPPPEVLFGRDFPYYSSFLAEWSAHARDFAAEATREAGLDAASFVVEIGSNDGYLLRHFHAAGARVLGIDPAQGPARAARAVGVPTLERYFDAALGAELAAAQGRADIIVANNVLAHVPDPNALLAGAAALLAPDGFLSVEVPYVRDLIDHGEFETIYHEHHCYFSVTSLAGLCARHGLGIERVRRLPYHGGSLQARARRDRAHAPEVMRMIEEETRAGLNGFDYYARFSGRVAERIARLRAMLGELRATGASIAAYGAAAKGAILLNAAGIGPELCAFVVDRNTHKHGKLMPGTGIPILPTAALLGRCPDYVLLLAWNWADEVIAQQSEYVRQGGRFIVPVPTLRVMPDA